MTMNPLDIDPSQLVVAVGSPDGLSVQDGDIVIDFHYTLPKNKVNAKNQFIVKVVPDYPLPPELKEEEQDNSKITVLKLSEQDALIMYKAQQEIKAYKKDHDDGSGTFFVQIKSACITKNFSFKELELDLFLKLHSDEGFFTFMEDIDVMELKNSNKLPSNQIAECTNS